MFDFAFRVIRSGVECERVLIFFIRDVDFRLTEFQFSRIGKIRIGISDDQMPVNFYQENLYLR